MPWQSNKLVYCLKFFQLAHGVHLNQIEVICVKIKLSFIKENLRKD